MLFLSSHALKPSTLCWWLFLLSTACASVSTPSGGPRDTEPPKVVEADPPNGATNVQAGTKVEIVFDEFINASGLASAYVASPPLPSAPEFVVKPKSIQFTLDTGLADSTTYTISFGNAIVDYTEGNAMRDFRYTFSTGEQLDSAFFVGRVQDLLTQKPPEKQVLIAAYAAQNDTGVFSADPAYLTYTDQQGNFRLSNLKQGRYHLYTIGDANRNLHWDNGEKVAFSQRALRPATDSSYRLTFQLYSPRPDQLALEESKLLHQAKLQLYFNKRIDFFRLQPAEASTDSIGLTKYLHPQQDTATVWFDSPLDSAVDMVLEADGMLLDTLNLDPRFADSAHTKKGVLSAKQGLKGSITHFPEADWHVDFTNPVRTASPPKGRLFRDTLLVDSLPFQAVPRFPARRQVDLPSLKQAHSLRLDDSTLCDAYGNCAPSIRLKFIPADPQAYAVLGLSLGLPQNQAFLIQLLKAKDFSLVRQAVHPTGKELTWRFLKPGKYRIRLVSDRNENGYWDAGVFERLQPPEAVYLLDKTIELRANWDVLGVNVSWPGRADSSASQ